MVSYGRTLPVLIYTCVLVMMLGLPGKGTVCETWRGYPPECPRSQDQPHQTKCCKYYNTPSCCEERATHICARSGSSKRSGGGEPSAGEVAIFCPMPGEPDDHRACCTSGSTMSCCSSTILIGALCGVFGLFLLIGLIIIVVCCVLVKKKKLICVKIREGKWTMMTAAGAEQFEMMRQQRAAGQHQAAPNITAPSAQYDPNAMNQPPPSYNQPASSQYWEPEKHKTPL